VKIQRQSNASESVAADGGAALPGSLLLSPDKKALAGAALKHSATRSIAAVSRGLLMSPFMPMPSISSLELANKP
jgi:hypothetical protein